jgi:hypothetical protein
MTILRNLLLNNSFNCGGYGRFRNIYPVIKEVSGPTDKAVVISVFGEITGKTIIGG